MPSTWRKEETISQDNQSKSSVESGEAMKGHEKVSDGHEYGTDHGGTSLAQIGIGQVTPNDRRNPCRAQVDSV